MTREFKFSIDWTLLFLILLPTFYIAGTELRDTQKVAFQLSAFILLAIMHVNKYIGAFLGWLVFQMVVLQDMTINTESVQNVFFGAMIYHFIVKYTNPALLKRYFWALSGLMLLNLFWMGLQSNNIDPIFHTEGNHIFSNDFSGFFALPAFVGNFAAVLLPITFTLSYALFPACLIGLFYSRSTFSMIGALLAVLFFFWFRKRIVFWIILGIGSVASLIYVLKVDLPGGQFNRRLKVWELVSKVAFQKQFTGHGLGSFKSFNVIEFSPSGALIMTNKSENLKEFLVKEVEKKGHSDLVPAIRKENGVNSLKNILRSRQMDFEKWDYAHNEFLTVFIETGGIGLFIITLYCIDLFKRFFKYALNDIVALSLISAFIALIVSSFGHFPFHVARLASIYICVMAFLDLCLIVLRKKKEAVF